MSFKQPAMTMAAAVLCAVVGSASASAQENCGNMYSHVMQAYQVQAPYYTRMLEHYNERCLSGSSMQPNWEHHHRWHRHHHYDNDRQGTDNGWGSDHDSGRR